MALAAFIFFAPKTYGQLHVDAQGEVGIGTTAPSSKLDIRNSSSFRTAYMYNSYAGTSTKYGLYNNVSSAGTGSRYGLYNFIQSNAASSSHYGIRNQNYFRNTSTGYGMYNYGYCYEGNGARYGIYNYLSCGSGCGTGQKYALYSGVSSNCGEAPWAGYFSGNVYVSGTFTQTSDASRKTNIEPLSGALGVISQLDAKTYDYIMDDDLNLPTEKQYGFIAQDLEKVLPEIVKEVDVISNPESEDEDAEPVINGQIMSVNYIALVPILVKGMQEQQQIIDAQQKRIEALEAKINR